MRKLPAASALRNLILGILSLGLVSGCGYNLQNSKSPLIEQEGVHRIYVKPLINNTYKAGVENTVYNALLRTLSVHRRIILVNRPELADAELRGSVGTATYLMSSATAASQLPPVASVGGADIRANIQIAQEYSASLGCDFSLVRLHPTPKQRDVIWGASFSRSALFAGANQLRAQGDTSALINESEFERALSDMATSMMDDVHESMLAMF